eukprot:gene10296-52602_t
MGSAEKKGTAARDMRAVSRPIPAWNCCRGCWAPHRPCAARALSLLHAEAADHDPCPATDNWVEGCCKPPTWECCSPGGGKPKNIHEFKAVGGTEVLHIGVGPLKPQGAQKGQHKHKEIGLKRLEDICTNMDRGAPNLDIPSGTHLGTPLRAPNLGAPLAWRSKDAADKTHIPADTSQYRTVKFNDDYSNECGRCVSV